MLRLRAQVLLPLDVVALRLIEDEGVAEVGDVAPDDDVVGGNPVGVEDVCDVVGRVEVAGIRSFSVSKFELFKGFETEKAIVSVFSMGTLEEKPMIARFTV